MAKKKVLFFVNHETFSDEKRLLIKNNVSNKLVKTSVKVLLIKNKKRIKLITRISIRRQI